jgi:glycosyltransferase involved in cell wall biosynthesis
MRILFIAPIPPPLNGQSLASQVILNDLKLENRIDLVNINKSRPKTTIDQIFRFFFILKQSLFLSFKSSKADRIYFTISESKLGNIKDLLFYILCFNSLHKMIIHLHGGAGMSIIMNRENKILAKTNVFFLKRMKGVIVLGESLRLVYADKINASKIFVVPNFAQDYLFLDEISIIKKNEDCKIVRLLYLSNLINGKGYVELLDAYFSLPEKTRQRIQIDLAGEFKTEGEKAKILNKILNHPNITYHGIVIGNKKKALFSNAHVFCLPTYYPYEGQPISILEAYAAGCVVMTTNHSGIPDIFKDSKNGYLVDKKSSESISRVIEKIVIDADRNLLLKKALYNSNLANEKYRAVKYCNELKKVILG